mmetsp:Transcript_67031/g.218229  ORF Transcript_67031/g.218229 Transcript_67031/m.218229 type:complete len:206 (-) Transcript_67031:1697-2314(-)
MAVPECQQLCHRVVPVQPAIIPRVLAGEKLEGEHTQSPPVDHVVVGMRRIDHLRGHVLRRAKQSGCLVDNKLGEAHVAQLRVALDVQQNILGFQVSVGDVPLVEVPQGYGNGGGVEHDRGKRQHHASGLGVGEQLVQMATAAQLQEHVNILLVLVGPEQLDNEVAVDQRQDVTFQAHLPGRLGQYDIALRQPLERVLTASLLCAH